MDQKPSNRGPFVCKTLNPKPLLPKPRKPLKLVNPKALNLKDY